MTQIKDFMNNKNKTADIIAAAVLLAVFTVVFVMWGGIKSVNFCDEIYTYILSNSNNEFLTFQLEAERWYSGDEINHILSAEDGFRFGQVMLNNKGDVHPPMYYFVIHFLSVLCAGSSSKWIGLAANWIFAAVSLIVLYTFIKKITDKRGIAIGACLIYISSPAVLSTNMFLRMYGMFSMWVLIFVYLTCLLEQCKEGQRKWHLYVLLGAATFFGFLTQYYFAVFCVIFTFLYCLYQLFTKKWKRCIPYVGSLAASVVVATLFWKTWVRHMFSGYLGGAVKENAFQFGKIFHSIKYGFIHMFTLMYNHLGIVAGIVMVAAVIFLIIKRDGHLKYILSLFITAALYSVAVVHLTPVHLLSYRYFFPIVVIAYAAEILAVYFSLEYLVRGKSAMITAALCVVLTVLNIIRPIYDKDSVMYVDLKGTYRAQMEVLDENKHIPWVYFGYENAMMTELMYDAVMADKFIMVNYESSFLSDKDIAPGSEFLLFAETGTNYEQDALLYAEACFPGQLEISQLTEKGLLNVYKVKHIVK
ncbi:MAG: glycosyltransferase family 39 protein [Alistipes sp.]|nr:glycosyltransferase family 39 protein [Alistipes sp.]